MKGYHPNTSPEDCKACGPAATVRVQMFSMPNFLRLDGPVGDSQGLDVGYLFPTDQAAEDFWNEARRKWVEHVAARRSALGKPAP